MQKAIVKKQSSSDTIQPTASGGGCINVEMLLIWGF